MEHHDGLSQTPGFAPAAQLFGDKIVPNLEIPLQPYYFWTRQVDVALLEAPCCEGTGTQASHNTIAHDFSCRDEGACLCQC